MKKKVFALLVALVMLLSISSTAFAVNETAPTDGATLRHSVAMIEVGAMISDGFWTDTNWSPEGRGTGFFIGVQGENPQYLITNRHVVDYYLDWEQGTTMYVVDSKGNYIENFRAQIRVYFDPNDYVEAYVVEAGDIDDKDVAILRLAEPTTKRSALPICVPTQAMADPNKKVFAVGFPGAAASEALRPVSYFGENDAVITDGIINKIFVQTGTGIQTIQQSAIIHSGNSGGPLVFENGAAIGVNTWSYDPSNASTALYYAVSMEFIKPYLDRNNVPYTLFTWDPNAPEPTPETVGQSEPDTPDPPPTPWYLYAIIGVAIVGVAVLLLVLLRKPKAKAVDGGTVKVDPSIGSAPAPKSSRVLVCVAGPLQGQIFPVEVGKKLYIGRDPSRCKVLFANGTPGVSNIHCVVTFDGRSATITDLESTYGTMVDGNKLTPKSPVTLHRGHPIDIGTDKNRFVLR